MTQLPIPLGPNPSVPAPVLTSAVSGIGGGGGGFQFSVCNPDPAPGAGATLFSGPSLGFNATEANRQTALFACTITGLLVRTDAAQPAGQDQTFAVRRNGVDTGLVVTVPGGSAPGTFFVTGLEVFANGDLFCVRATQAAGASAGATIFGWTVTGTT